MASLRSKLDRAIVAYLKTVSGVTPYILPANSSVNPRPTGPITDVLSSQGPEEPMFTGNHLMNVRIRIECPAANQPAQTNPNRNRVVLDGYVDATFDAFHVVADGDQDYRETARLITVAGRALAATTLVITTTDAAADTMRATVLNLTTGTPVLVAGITGASGVYYLRFVLGGIDLPSSVYVVFSLYDTAAHATAGGSTGKFDVTVGLESGTLTLLPSDYLTLPPSGYLDNVDLADFTCQFVQGIVYLGGEPEGESSNFVEMMTLACRCCAANVEV